MKNLASFLFLYFCLLLPKVWTQAHHPKPQSSSDFLKGWLEEKSLEPHFQRIAPEFLPYVQRYEAAKNAPIADHIIIIFAEGFLLDVIEEKLGAASCNLDHSVITIHPNEWEMFSDFHKEMTIAHELGHCDLHKVHTITFGHGPQESIMTILPVTTLEFADRDELYKKLFSPI